MRNWIVAILSFATLATFAADIPVTPPSSDWAWLIPGVWFALVVVATANSLVVSSPHPSRPVFFLALLATPVALVLGLRLAEAQFCGLCVARITVVLSILALSWPPTSSTAASVSRKRSIAKTAVVTAGLVIVSAFTVLAVREMRFERWLVRQIRAKELMPAAGGPDVGIVVLTDYQCPACRGTHLSLDPTIDALVDASGGRVSFVALDFPLDSKCNASIRNSLHPMACDAAVAVRVATGHGMRTQVVDYLFDHLTDLTPGSLSEFLSSLGLQPTFVAEKETLVELIRGDVRLGRSAGVTGTPTYFVNGIRIAGWSVADLRSVVSAELKRTRAGRD